MLLITAGLTELYILLALKLCSPFRASPHKFFQKKGRKKTTENSRKKRKKESQFFSAGMSECKIFDNKKFAEMNDMGEKK